MVPLIWSAVSISKSVKALGYTDQALAPVGEEEDELLDLFNRTTGGKAAANHQRKVARLTRHGSS